MLGRGRAVLPILGILRRRLEAGEAAGRTVMWRLGLIPVLYGEGSRGVLSGVDLGHFETLALLGRRFSDFYPFWEEADMIFTSTPPESKYCELANVATFTYAHTILLKDHHSLT